MNIDNDNYSGILKKAYELGKKKHPGAPSQHHTAFANSVACFVTGASGGYGGPSVREHTAERMGGATKQMGEWTFEEAATFCDSICYGEITETHWRIWRENSSFCFDDTEEDLEVLCRFQV